MSVQLRPYQAAANAAVRAYWSGGRRRVLLVAPTGAGKTVLGEDLVGQQRAVWVAPREAIVTQTADRLAKSFGRSAVGLVLGGRREDTNARIQVGTIHSFIARESRPHADVLVLDEAHHYLADTWRELVEAYLHARCVGLTATPQRGDGSPMEDMFEALVVAASYSELLAGGFLVPTLVLRPDQSLGGHLAQDPVEAWLKHSGGAQTFFSAARVHIAQQWTQRLVGLGVQAATIHALTPAAERRDHMARFRAGKLRVLCHVNTLTEGVDVPEAACAVLARAFGTVGDYIQTVGRVLRPAPGKEHAIVLDLVGATHTHGLPTDDREYSLSGRAISGEGPERATAERAEFSQEVRGFELQAVGTKPVLPPAPVVATPRDEAKLRAEYDRLVSTARQFGRGPALAAIRFREMFGEEPPAHWSAR